MKKALEASLAWKKLLKLLALNEKKPPLRGFLGGKWEDFGKKSPEEHRRPRAREGERRFFGAGSGEIGAFHKPPAGGCGAEEEEEKKKKIWAKKSEISVLKR